MGLTQADVAERVGIAYEVYGRLERGGMAPSVHTLRKLCLVLQVSADTALALQAPAEAPDALPPPVEPKDAHLRRLVRRARHLTPTARRALAYLSGLLPQETPPPAASGEAARAEQE